jgi:Ca-activated chloride channel family protein
MNMLELWFTRPLALVGLIALVFLWRYWIKTAKANQAKALPKVLADVLIRRARFGGGPWARTAISTLLVCIVFAIADPVLPLSEGDKRFAESTWLVVIDLSESTVGDQQLLHAAQAQVDALIQQKSDASVGMLVLAGSAHWVLPPTQDVSLLRRYLYSLESSLMPVQGSQLAPLVQTLGEIPTGTAVAPVVLVSSADGLAAYAQEINNWDLLKHPLVTMDWSNQASVESTLQRLERLHIGVHKDQGRAIGDWFAAVALLVGCFAYRSQWSRAVVASLALVWFFLPGPSAEAASGEAVVGPASEEEIPPPLSLLLDMWLTRDQQGHWLLRLGENLAASQRFESPMGRALALYRLSRFRQAASELEGLDTFDAKFLEGNAWAHSRNYREALIAYDEALQLAPEHPEILHNIQQIKALVELAGEQGESQQADLGDLVTFETEDSPDEDASFSDQELVMLETIEADRLLSDPEALRRWRARIEASPQRFLANRFRQEWLDRQAKDTPND